MFENIPKVALGLVATSRDCFPIELSRTRRDAVVEAYRARRRGDLHGADHH